MIQEKEIDPKKLSKLLVLVCIRNVGELENLHSGEAGSFSKRFLASWYKEVENYFYAFLRGFRNEAPYKALVRSHAELADSKKWDDPEITLSPEFLLIKPL